MKVKARRRAQEKRKSKIYFIPGMPEKLDYPESFNFKHSFIKFRPILTLLHLKHQTIFTFIIKQFNGRNELSINILEC